MNHRRYLNRELSLLDFQRRVLAQAENSELPLLERLKFVAIVSHNLDEFFQVRVAGLREQVAAGYRGTAVDGTSPAEQLVAIRASAAEIQQRRDALFQDELLPALKRRGIALTAFEELDGRARRSLEDVFEDQVFPVLTPLAVDPSHPFPYISNLSLNLAVQVSANGGAAQFARVKVPPLLPRFLVLPDGRRFVPLEQVIAAKLGRLFPGMEVLGHYPFRLTRNADPAIEEDEAQDLLEAMETALRAQQRAARATRLEVHPSMDREVLALLLDELALAAQDVYETEAPLDLGGLWSLHALDRPDLKDPVWAPVTHPRLTSSAGDETDVFSAMRKGDFLVHLPYESFATSTAAMVAQAADDPDVLAIKQTLYRTSIPDDPALGGEEAIVHSLIEAAEVGKQVVVLVELKARFDEYANIRWARMLEEAGVHVVYGVVGLKTHSKILLVVRREGTEIRRYSNIGTGNYNPKTARLYEDLSLFTTDPAIGDDLSELFNVLTGYGRQSDYRKLWVAPTTLRDRLVEAIEAQATQGEDGEIVMKLNHIIDPDVIDALYAASQAGTPVRLIVRSTCGLIPGVPGMSDTITVRSLVGRWLEHSRVFRFGRPENGATYHLGSADLMPRNLSGRVETMTPVEDPALQNRLELILQTELEDDVLAWELASDGNWSPVTTEKGANSHELLQEEAMSRSWEIG